MFVVQIGLRCVVWPLLIIGTAGGGNPGRSRKGTRWYIGCCCRMDWNLRDIVSNTTAAIAMDWRVVAWIDIAVVGIYIGSVLTVSRRRITNERLLIV